MFSVNARSFSQTTTSTEQPKATIEQKVSTFMVEMSKVVVLSDIQKKQVEPLVTEFLKQKEIDVAQAKGDKNALANAYKIRMTNFSNKLKEVVSEEQFTTLKAYWDGKLKKGGSMDSSHK
jgi:TPP-dependent indolepyruvate ferredoxin oxidoreductase alpha subunit